MKFKNHSLPTIYYWFPKVFQIIKKINYTTALPTFCIFFAQNLYDFCLDFYIMKLWIYLIKLIIVIKLINLHNFNKNIKKVIEYN